ncbi:cation:proton antiporter [Tepidicella xavieri]|uniref:Transporter (CPA2 family) n=1 Tax=Tepidicella xavieri TaxID=360241 RepID=A0A4R6U9U4_9BURK|nr:cation:proton antiporter [Tepidicella xavieri]TDQ41773.1 transporter (CPA2 family) [Tepidicella xavieri]
MLDVLQISDPVAVFALVAFLILLAPIVMGRWQLPGTIGLLLAGAVLGPNGLGVLARDQSFVLFGTVGLLYIMFTAALEIDMVVLKRSKFHSIVFGLCTFAIPQGLGTLVGHYVLGFSWPAAILLASLFASHTLLAYPIASRLGIARNTAVTTAVGGTIITDTLALLVLAVIAGLTRGEVDEYFWYRLGASLGLYVFAILYGLPKLARWFFRHVGRDGVTEFVFVLAVVFGCASLSHAAGSEPIVGAFLAGLALNRLIPHNSTLMNRIQFTGEAIFVPFFLLSVGMLLDVRVFLADGRALLITTAMVATVTVSKWLAARLSSLLLGYSPAQARVVFGLSVAQAAATLAATVVGYEIGLFDDAVVNGAIVMILVTCVIAPWQVDRYGRLVAQDSADAPVLAPTERQRILTALSERSPSRHLLDLALMLRKPDHEQPIYPITVVQDNGNTTPQVAGAEQVLSDAVSYLSQAEVPASPLTRIDLNLASGILKARRELNATEVVMGWSEQSRAPEFFFGSLMENLLRDRDFSLVVLRPREPLNTTRRLLLAIPPEADLEPGFQAGVGLIKRLSHQLSAPVMVLTEEEGAQRIFKRLRAIKPDCDLVPGKLPRWAGLRRVLQEHYRDGDLIVLLGARQGGLAWKPVMTRLPEDLADTFPKANLLVVYAGEPDRENTLSIVNPEPATRMA